MAVLEKEALKLLHEHPIKHLSILTLIFRDELRPNKLLFAIVYTQGEVTSQYRWAFCGHEMP